MKAILIIIILSFPSIALAQASQRESILFDTCHSWKQIKEKASAQHKGIFIDCYATWCVPCKMVDEQVFHTEEASKAIKERFIAVKVQVDVTPMDPIHVKNWYSDSKTICAYYAIKALPTTLFLSADGTLLYRNSGFMDVGSFVRATDQAFILFSRLTEQLNKFDNGTLAFSEMLNLSENLKNTGDMNKAQKVLDVYVHRYLLNLPKSEVISAANIAILSSYLSNYSAAAPVYQDRAFKFLLINASAINKKMQSKLFIPTQVDFLIYKTEIEPLLKNPAEPDWGKIANYIDRHFGSWYTHRAILYAKYYFYNDERYKGQWQKITKATIQYWQKYGLDTSSFIAKATINNFCFDIVFKHIADKSILRQAMKWMEIINKGDVDCGFLDTKANLAYKLGHTEEAILLEKRAEDQEYNNALKGKTTPDSIYKITRLKMMAGKQTWL